MRGLTHLSSLAVTRPCPTHALSSLLLSVHFNVSDVSKFSALWSRLSGQISEPSCALLWGDGSRLGTSRGRSLVRVAGRLSASPEPCPFSVQLGVSASLRYDGAQRTCRRENRPSVRPHPEHTRLCPHGRYGAGRSVSLGAPRSSDTHHRSLHTLSELPDAGGSPPKAAPSRFFKQGGCKCHPVWPLPSRHSEPPGLRPGMIRKLHTPFSATSLPPQTKAGLGGQGGVRLLADPEINI